MSRKIDPLFANHPDVLAQQKHTQDFMEGLKRDLAPDAGAAFVFTYKNHRGEIATRTVSPISVRFGSTEWHPEPQWLLKAFDHDKRAEREFAMADIAPPPQVDSGREEIARALQDAIDVFEGMNDDEINVELLPRLRLALRPERSGGRGT